MFGKKRIVIKNADLHPEVKASVDSVMASRKGRVFLNNIPGVGALGATFVFFGFPHTVAESVISGTATAAAALVAHKMSSVPIRRETRGMGEKIHALEENKKKFAWIALSPSRGALDRSGEYKIRALKATHPFGFVNRRGDIVLVPNTTFERLLRKAQQNKVAREFVPGRYRFSVQAP